MTPHQNYFRDYDPAIGRYVESEVQRIAGREIKQRDIPRDWSMHAIRDGTTDLWLGFPDGKLQFALVLWAQNLMKMAMYSRIDLCGKESEPTSPSR